MIKFKYVEEYLETIAGHRDPVSGKPISTWIFTFDPIISLARYDVKVLESMAQTVGQQQPLTERQGELLVKIVLKYERQLAGKSIDISPVRNPVWRIPLRQMDYSRSIAIENDIIVVRFPFNAEMIDSIRDFGKSSQGKVVWNRSQKIWELGLTEYNLSWIVAWGQLHNFEIDPAITDLMNRITETESTKYSIELCLDEHGLNITNATDSLREYIVEKVGGFDESNLLKLVDMSSVLGYTVKDDIAQALIAEYGPRFYNLLANREIKINPNKLMTSDDFESILSYAETVGRGPVVIYEPDLSGRMLTKLKDRFGDNTDEWSGRFIHTVKPIKELKNIALIISSAGMVFGGDKQVMLQRAEKVVYCAQDVYNKKNTSGIKNIAG